MKISLIAAISNNFVLGKKNRMIWHIPPDLAYFKSITMNHHVLMGRKTYESLPKALTGRTMIVISKDDSAKSSDAYWFTSLQKGIRFAQNRGEEELFIIGGSTIFKQTIGQADTLYLTEIEADAEGDTYFPELDYRSWKLRKQTKQQEYKDLKFSFKVYQRRPSRKTISHQDE